MTTQLQQSVQNQAKAPAPRLPFSQKEAPQSQPGEAANLSDLRANLSVLRVLPLPSERGSAS